MVEAISAIIAAVLRIGVPIYLAAAIATAILLFLPDSGARFLGLLEFRRTYQGYLGATFVISISLVIATGLSSLWDIIDHRLGTYHSRRRLINHLRSLTDAEKRFLLPFIILGENTLYAEI